ncbi:hypothetical protein JTE90_020422 [Oedothorax gibbosus]|uniref:Uncharacterized protein n=1 Tax=Oedothorax gibbosus TaxID=931172 RepID=A0AAV6UE53_9ARAC|nr:hypothetical protein JTE90_020422 [Oedothorax gibbosus]
MKLVYLSSILLLLCFANAEDSPNQKREKEDALAYESFNSPVYGAPSAYNPAKGYPLPNVPAAAPVVAPALPSSYAPGPYTTYLSSLGANPYTAYNRYPLMPYTAPYYGYGAYGAGYPFTAGYGYPAGFPYGRSSAGYAAYPGFPYPGYRFPGLGYSAGALRGPVAGMPAPVAPGFPYTAPVVAGIPAGVPAVNGKGSSLPYGYAAQKLPVY